MNTSNNDMTVINHFVRFFYQSYHALPPYNSSATYEDDDSAADECLSCDEFFAQNYGFAFPPDWPRYSFIASQYRAERAWSELHQCED